MYGWVEEAGVARHRGRWINHRPTEFDHPCTVDSDVVVDELLRPWVVIAQIAPVRVGRCEAHELRLSFCRNGRAQAVPFELHELILAWRTPRCPGRSQPDIRGGSATPPMTSTTQTKVSATVTDEPVEALSEHARHPVAFLVERVLDVSLVDEGLGGLVLTERPVEVPWVKDYDAIEGEGPITWPERFDVTNWAHRRSRRQPASRRCCHPGRHSRCRHVGRALRSRSPVGPARASRGPIIRRRDLAVPGGRSWACERACRTLKVETQNVNMPACRFYRRMGCTLAAVDRFAYVDLPDEVQLIWSKDL